MKGSVAFVVLLAGLYACPGLAARPSDAIHHIIDESYIAETSGLQKLVAWLEGGAKQQEEEETVYIKVKYIVPTDRQDEFIKSWKEVEGRTLDEEGNQVYDLKKTRSDNLIFFGYGEWQSMDALKQHIKSDYIRKFGDFLDDNNVKWEMFPLRNKGSRSKQGKQVTDNQQQEKLAHILVRAYVPPQVTDEFVKAWTEAAERTWEEDSNHIYALHKTITNNHEFWAYGTWDSFDDYMEHSHSDHIKRLRSFADERGIVWFRTPLKKLGQQSE